ncbi:MAG: trigger factor [Planctomycetota bacterium]|nr:trigger factor [Planctomycetota bacterium]
MPSSEESVATLSEPDNLTDAMAPRKIQYKAEISEAGPCRKRIKVTIPQEEIALQLEDSIGDMRKEAQVPGFRPGRVPKILIQRRFKKEMSDRVKTNLMLATLEQVEKDHKLNLISQPQLDFEAVALPDTGSMSFEMEVEVRPDFDAPSYSDLKVKRPSRVLTPADVEKQYKSFLERYADLVPKTEGGAELGDLVIADLVFSRNGEPVNTAKEIQFRVQPELRFQDGRVPTCGVALAGVKPGQKVTTKALVGTASADPTLRGQEIDVTFEVNDLKFLRLPEVNDDFLGAIGFETEDELKEALKEVLQGRLESFELPRDLVNRQTRDTMRKRVMDLRESGLSENQIRAREAELRANAFESTVRGLKEYFILDKIATGLDIKVESEDLNREIEKMAEREDESPRRIRARLERENSMDFLAIQVLENKTIDYILEHVAIQDVLMVDEAEVETLEESATPGGLVDAAEEAKAEAAAGLESSTDSEDAS